MCRVEPAYKGRLALNRCMKAKTRLKEKGRDVSNRMIRNIN